MLRGNSIISPKVEKDRKFKQKHSLGNNHKILEISHYQVGYLIKDPIKDIIKDLIKLKLNYHILDRSSTKFNNLQHSNSSMRKNNRWMGMNWQTLGEELFIKMDTTSPSKKLMGTIWGNLESNSENKSIVFLINSTLIFNLKLIFRINTA